MSSTSDPTASYVLLEAKNISVGKRDWLEMLDENTLTILGKSFGKASDLASYMLHPMSLQSVREDKMPLKWCELKIREVLEPSPASEDQDNDQTAPPVESEAELTLFSVASSQDARTFPELKVDTVRGVVTISRSPRANGNVEPYMVSLRIANIEASDDISVMCFDPLILEQPDTVGIQFCESKGLMGAHTLTDSVQGEHHLYVCVDKSLVEVWQQTQCGQ